MQDNLNRFIEYTASDHMPKAASQLLDLLESDEVEPLHQPGEEILAEDLADKLEIRVDRIRNRGGRAPTGLRIIEDAIAHLRARDGENLLPWSYEDSEGSRWFILADDDEEVIACYSTAPFVEADI